MSLGRAVLSTIRQCLEPIRILGKSQGKGFNYNYLVEVAAAIDTTVTNVEVETLIFISALDIY